MAFKITRRGLWTGVRASAPMHLATAPFGLAFGVFAADAGLDAAQAMAMTVIMAAGASQIAALELLGEGAPVAVILVTGAAINLRMAMYSAAISAHWRGAPLWTRALGAYCLHDQAFAMSMRRYGDRPDEPVADKAAFFLGVGFATLTTWTASSYVGFRLGAAAPAGVSLDFIAPAIFLALVAPMLRTAAHGAAALVGAGASVAFVWAPFGLGVLIGGVCGIVAGAAVETWTRRGAHAKRGEAEGAT